MNTNPEWVGKDTWVHWWAEDEGTGCQCGATRFQETGDAWGGRTEVSTNRPRVARLTCVSCGRAFLLTMHLTEIPTEEPRP